MKVKGIELMQMIMSGEIKDGTKIKVIFGSYRPVYIFRNNCLYEKNEESQEMGVSILLSGHDFEILEDKTEEIEEYKTTYTERCIDIEVRDKLNEVIRAVNKLNKQDTSKETNCMTD